MARFSKRYGYTSVRDVMQPEYLDDQFKNGLRSVFYDTVARHSSVEGSTRIKASSKYYPNSEKQNHEAKSG